LYVAVRIGISVLRGPAHLSSTRLAELPPISGFPRDGYSDPNRKHMPDIWSCTFYHIHYIFIYFKLLTFIKLYSKEIYVFSPVTIFLQQRMKLQLHSSKACQCTARDSSGTPIPEFPAWVKLTETPVWYARMEYMSWRYPPTKR
jgi:hypothetical protein